MRRFIGSILTLAMFLGILLPPALAVEAEGEAPAVLPAAAAQAEVEADIAVYDDGEAYDDWGDADEYVWTEEDEEEYARWLAEWEAEAAAARAERIAALGGTPGQMNLRLNERMVAFPDAAPELQNGHMMVPVRALMEALGAEVSWLEEEKQVILSGEGFLLELTLGSDRASYSENGEVRTLTLDAPAYQKVGRCYVPLRLISETLGYETYWDAEYQTAVLLGRAAILAEINAQFTAFNRYLAANALDLQTRSKLTERLDLTVEILDSLQGNRSFAFPVSLQLHTGDGGLSLQGDFDLSKLGSLLIFAGILEENSAELEELGVLMAKHSFACKLSPEGMLSFHMPLLDTQLALPEGGENTAAPLWYQVDLQQLYPEWSALLEMKTIGEMAWTMAMLSAEYGNPIDYYDDMQNFAAIYAMLADANLKQSGQEFRLQMDLDRLIALVISSAGYEEDMAAWIEEDIRDVLDLFELDLRFQPNGSHQSSLRMKLSFENYCDFLDTILQAEFSSEASTRSGEQNGLIQMKNHFNLSLKESFRRDPMQAAPDWTPPEGSRLIDLMESGVAGDPFAGMLSQALPKLAAQLP